MTAQMKVPSYSVAVLKRNDIGWFGEPIAPNVACEFLTQWADIWTSRSVTLNTQVFTSVRFISAHVNKLTSSIEKDCGSSQM